MSFLLSKSGGDLQFEVSLRKCPSQYLRPRSCVLLCFQPVLSASVLDYLVHHDKKYPPEYSTAENFVEMQVRYFHPRFSRNSFLSDTILHHSCIEFMHLNKMKQKLKFIFTKRNES